MELETQGIKNLRPTGSRILVRPDKAKEKTKYGVLIPDNSKEKPSTGTVVKIGPGLLLENGKIVPSQVSVGDRVLFSQYGNLVSIKIQNINHEMIDESDVLAVLDPETEVEQSSG